MAQKWETDQLRVDNKYGKDVHLCAGGGYKKDQDCSCYKAYGYNCLGTRREPDGRVLSSPFGFGEKEHTIGSDFGETYAEDHPEEFKKEKKITRSNDDDSDSDSGDRYWRNYESETPKEKKIPQPVYDDSDSDEYDPEKAEQAYQEWRYYEKHVNDESDDD